MSNESQIVGIMAIFIIIAWLHISLSMLEKKCSKSISKSLENNEIETAKAILKVELVSVLMRFVLWLVVIWVVSEVLF